MDTLNQLNQAMAYIEAHLTEDIDIQRAAQIAGCSEYHFRRMFAFLSGMALGEYIRRRRLSQAALDLRAGSLRVIDVAVRYGYDSPDAFGRAFHALHGMTPTQAREEGVTLRAVPPMTFQLTIQGAESMEYRIVEKDAFYIIGMKRRVTLVYHGVNPEIAAMYQSLTMDDIEALSALSDTEPAGLINASFNFSEGRADGGQLDHMIGVATHQSTSDGWDVLPVAAGTWAVFTTRGKFPDALQNVWGRIYAEWFPMSGYEVVPGPEILWNEDKDTSKPDYHSEIWIPVIKR